MLVKSQVDELKAELKGYLRECNDGEEQALPNVSGSQGDDGDMAQVTAEALVVATTNGNRRQLCQQVNDALQRIKEGTYTDTCAVCGRPIPFERLKATPWALAHVQESGRCINGSLHDE